MASSWSLSSRLRGLFQRKTIDETTWDDLETALIGADFGPDIADEVIEDLHARVDRYGTTDPADLQRMLREVLEERLSKLDTTLKLSARPAVVLVVGVNGVGKTTTIGKFAKFLKTYDRTVLVGAADTFRAAAVEQVATWAQRAGVDVVRRRSPVRTRLRSRTRRSRRPSTTAPRSSSSTPPADCTPRPG